MRRKDQDTREAAAASFLIFFSLPSSSSSLFTKMITSQKKRVKSFVKNLLFPSSLYTMIIDGRKGHQMKFLAAFLCLWAAGCAHKTQMIKSSLKTVESPFKITCQEEDLPQAVAKNIKNNVVWVYIKNKESKIIDAGTGFVIGKNGLIATAKHVVRRAKGQRIYAVIYEDKKVTIRYAFGFLSHFDADAALLIVRHRFKSAIPLRLKNLALNEKLFTAGFPLPNLPFYLYPRLALAVSSGNFFRNIHRDASSDHYGILAHLPITGGSSGGVVFDRYGNAVGLIAAYTTEPHRSAYTYTVIIPSAYFQAMMAACKLFNCALKIH